MQSITSTNYYSVDLPHLSSPCCEAADSDKIDCFHFKSGKDFSEKRQEKKVINHCLFSENFKDGGNAPLADCPIYSFFSTRSIRVQPWDSRDLEQVGHVQHAH
jgi:hypothetical protein